MTVFGRDGYGERARCNGGGTSDSAVLQNQHIGGVDLKFLRRSEINFRVWFPVGYIIRRKNELKT